LVEKQRYQLVGIAVGWSWNQLLFKIGLQVSAYFGMVDIVAASWKRLWFAILKTINLVWTSQE
jgi:hypothetical protein